MRISDWSSDVCSSDLPCPYPSPARPARKSPARADGRRWRGTGGCPHVPEARPSERRCGRPVPRDNSGGRKRRPPAAEYRRVGKHVVWGKSVSVRVDFGGRRIIKNKIILLDTTPI